MAKLFIGIYNFFGRHKVVFYLFLAACLAVMSFFASRVTFDENITGFFPDTPEAHTMVEVFDNLKIKDKMTIMVSAADADSIVGEEVLEEVAAEFEKGLMAQVGKTHVTSFVSRVDDGVMGDVTGFVYDRLPLFLTDEDYARFDSLTTRQGIAHQLQKAYTTLLTPSGMVMKDLILKDPLGLSGNVLGHLRDFQPEAKYTLSNGFIYSQDRSNLLMFLTPVFPSGNTRENDKLISAIEEEIARLQEAYPAVRMEYFGGPSLGVYNARQIKRDTFVTLSVALLIIVVFISVVFKRKVSVPLIITPVLFGVLFSLCLIFFIQGSISAIAVGAGSVVFGIALSYSIHVLAHQNHVSSVQQLIKELAYPLTVGGFTTIGAFFGLMFTSSGLLRDFGLFAALALIGTTLFCLIFLPHFLKGQAEVKQGRILGLIERANAYRFDRNKWLVGGVLVLTVVCLFFIHKVGFESDMMALNYEPAHLKRAEQKLSSLFEGTEKTVLFVSVGRTVADAAGVYVQTNRMLSELKEQGLVKNVAQAERFLVSDQEQQRRLRRWDDYWTPEKKKWVREALQAEMEAYPFRKDSFGGFYQWLNTPFHPYDYAMAGSPFGQLLSAWSSSTDSLTMLITQVRLNSADKEAVYRVFKGHEGVVIFDRSYFTGQWVGAVKDDFNLILYISSCLIFLALLLSYGRIELTLMSFLPMFVSWLIILGLMGMFGIQFNIINIIFSTFIFGIGDDFSIFIMDGLQNQYRSGQKVLNAHKTAIFFAAFTTVVGMGAMLFAKHPALRSISLISILGVISVVFVAYTLQPVIFHLFIGRPASKGKPPYTMAGVLQSLVVVVFFLTGYVLLWFYKFLLRIAPVPGSTRRALSGLAVRFFCRMLLRILLKRGGAGSSAGSGSVPAVDLSAPVILWVRQRSDIDILFLLSWSSRLLLVVPEGKKSLLWRAMARCVGVVSEDIREVPDGYSLGVFSERTAVAMSDSLHLDIVPVLIGGSERAVSGGGLFQLHPAWTGTKLLPRVGYSDSVCGTKMEERARVLSDQMDKALEQWGVEMDTPDNPWFYHTLIRNYIYKGPVEEWYMRVKVRMERNYGVFHQLIPLRGRITDIGCGFGPLCYMLSMLSKHREILGIDYDEDKIAVARNAYSRTEHLDFVCADALTFEFPESEVFVLNDVLHYMSYAEQEALLKRCAGLLRPGGRIIVRDGNVSDGLRHRVTRLTEFFSTRVLRFNKTAEGLCFASHEMMLRIGEECGMTVRMSRNDSFTSNTIFVFEIKGGHEQV